MGREGGEVLNSSLHLGSDNPSTASVCLGTFSDLLTFALLLSPSGLGGSHMPLLVPGDLAIPCWFS